VDEKIHDLVPCFEMSGKCGPAGFRIHLINRGAKAERSGFSFYFDKITQAKA
jgi:hypothetical protein